jgi:hypothetical protein
LTTDGHVRDVGVQIQPIDAREVKDHVALENIVDVGHARHGHVLAHEGRLCRPDNLSEQPITERSREGACPLPLMLFPKTQPQVTHVRLWTERCRKDSSDPLPSLGRSFLGLRLLVVALSLDLGQTPGGTGIGEGRRSDSCTAPPATADRPLVPFLNSRLPAVVVGMLCAVIQFVALVRGGFVLDDFANLARNKRSISLDLLTAPIGTNHFQPLTQLVVWLSAEPLHANYPATVAVLAVITGFGAYWMVRLLDALFGTRVLHLVIGFLLGTSWILMNTNQWFAGSAAAASAAFAVAACLSFALWLRSGRWYHYLYSLLATAAAIGFWEQALAVPAILAMLWLCFRFDRRRLPRVLVGLIPFFTLVLVYLCYVEAQPWSSSISIPAVSQWGQLLWVMLMGGLLPSLVGTGTSSSAFSTTVVFSDALAATGLALGALWLWTRRRLRWLSLGFFLVGLLLVSIPVAIERNTAPSAAGITSRYLTFLPMLLAIAAAGAVRDAPGDVDADLRLAPAVRSRPATWLVRSVIGAACLLYLGNLHATYVRGPGLLRQLGDQASVVSGNIAAGINALPRSQEHSIVDVSLPFPVWYNAIFGYLPKNGEFDRLMPNWSSTARTYGEGPRLVGLDAHGQLRRVSFDAHGSGPLAGGPSLGASASLGSSVGAPLYERIAITAPYRTTVRVVIVGVRPIEPPTPWLISVDPGMRSFVLPVWSTALRSVRVSGRGVKLVGLQTGTVVLGKLEGSAAPS